MLAAFHSLNQADAGPIERLGGVYPNASVEHVGETHFLVTDRSAFVRQSRDLFVAANARIDNRAELAAPLGLERPAIDSLSAPALVAAAYGRWGDACPDELIGDFAFVIWDAEKHRLLAACDPMGMCALFFARRGRSWAFASNTVDLLAMLDASPQADPFGLASWIVGRPLPNTSILRGIEQLAPGQTLLVERGRESTRMVWQLDNGHSLRYASVDDYENHLHELLSRCVADRLPDDGSPVACQLSGGIDSSSVAALAAAQLSDATRDIVPISHLYELGDDWDEREPIGQTAEKLGLRRHLHLPIGPYLDTPYAQLYPPLLDSPGTVLSPRYLDELRLVRDRGARVLLTGSGGDEMTWGHSLSYHRRLLRGDFTVVGEVLRGSRELELPLMHTILDLFVRPLLPDALRRWRRRLTGRQPWPAWMPDKTARQLGLEELLFEPRPHYFANPASDVRYHAWQTSSTFHSVRSYGAAGEAVGVSVRHPFFDRRLAEFSFAIPDDLWLRERYPKWLLRRAMQHQLPEPVIWNRHKVVFDNFFARLLNGQRETVRALLSHTGLQELGLIDNRALLSAFDSALDRRPPTISTDLLHVLMVQVWFQRHLSPGASE